MPELPGCMSQEKRSEAALTTNVKEANLPCYYRGATAERNVSKSSAMDQSHDHDRGGVAWGDSVSGEFRDELPAAAFCRTPGFQSSNSNEGATSCWSKTDRPEIL